GKPGLGMLVLCLVISSTNPPLRSRSQSSVRPPCGRTVSPTRVCKRQSTHSPGTSAPSRSSGVARDHRYGPECPRPCPGQARIQTQGCGRPCLQEMQLEFSTEPRMLEKARREADEFLDKIRRGLI